MTLLNYLQNRQSLQSLGGERNKLVSQFILEEESGQERRADFEVLLPEHCRLAGRRDDAIEQIVRRADFPRELSREACRLSGTNFSVYIFIFMAILIYMV